MCLWSLLSIFHTFYSFGFSQNIQPLFFCYISYLTTPPVKYILVSIFKLTCTLIKSTTYYLFLTQIIHFFIFKIEFLHHLSSTHVWLPSFLPLRGDNKNSQYKHHHYYHYTPQIPQTRIPRYKFGKSYTRHHHYHYPTITTNTIQLSQ